MTGSLEGGCACRSVRYALKSRPMFVNCCHCTDCQRLTGSAFVINAVIETNQIEVSGPEPVAIQVPSTSGKPHDIHRCPRCQTALWSDYGRRPQLRFVRVGTLDDPGSLEPDAHVFTSTKLPWVQLEGSAPAFEEYYDLKAIWPKQSLERRRAALS